MNFTLQRIHSTSDLERVLGGHDVLVPSAAALGLTVTYVHADDPQSREPGDMTGVVLSVQPRRPVPGSTLTVTVAN